MNTISTSDSELGYRFYPTAEPHDIGAAQLDVMIRALPATDHFDPEALICLVASDGGRSTRLRVQHPWQQEPTYRICAGEVIIESRHPAQVTALTFGGALAIESDDRRTICRLTSPVPILQHAVKQTTLEQLLIEEINVLWAQRRAALDEDDFERRLAAADPVRLYRACLVALAQKFENIPAHSQDDTYRRFRHYLHTVMQTTTEENIPALSELL